jgi:exodeoxyribonuclease-5
LNYTNNNFTSIFLSCLPFVPNSDQSNLIALLSDFISNKNEREIFVLKGYAGTGKTNMIGLGFIWFFSVQLLYWK